jgi:serine/threonine protein phosphatase PrpC
MHGRGAVSKLTTLQVGQISDKGGRPTNEDATYSSAHVEGEKLEAKGQLYAVADGTGGHEGGQTASNLALEVIGEHYYDNPATDVVQSLREAIQAAQKTLLGLAESVRSWQQMSTTFVGVVIQQGRLYFANVGDSRAYLVRNDTIRQISVDHVWRESDENYGSLTRWLGGGNAPQVEVEFALETLQPDDVVVLCSDGLTDVVHPDEIKMLATRYPPDQAARRLVEQANRRRSPDNVTATVIRCGAGAQGAGLGRWIAIAGGAVLVLALILGALLMSGGKRDDVTPAPALLPSATWTLTAIPTDTPVLPTVTPTPIRRIEVDRTATATPTEALAPTDTPAAGPTSTRQPTNTPTFTPRPTNTPTHTPTFTPTSTPAPTSLPTAGPPPPEEKPTRERPPEKPPTPRP